MGSLSEQLEAARGETALVKLQLERANAIMENSTRYQIPADLAAAIYDIALSEGIDPALGFQLVKIESSFKATARSNDGRDRLHPAPGGHGPLLSSRASPRSDSDTTGRPTCGWASGS